METTVYGSGYLGFRGYSPLKVDRIWGIWDLSTIYPKPYSIYVRGTIC